MKYFLACAVLTILFIMGFIAYQQGAFSNEKIAYDDEQVGLDDQIVIHFSHVVAENTPKGMAAKKFAELVEEKSGGRIIVKVFPDGILHSDYDELEALLDNEVQMIAPTTSKMTSRLPSWQVLDLPFLIETNEELKAVLTGDLSEALLEDLSKLHIKGLTFWSNGFKQISSNSPIVRAEDFRGKRVRTMDSGIISQQFEYLHADPVPLNFDDVYYEIQNHLIDAQENTISNIYSKKFYTMENYITLSNHGIMAYAVMMNEEFWNSLTEKDQQIILEALEEMQGWQFALAEKVNEEYLRKLSNEPDVKIMKLDEENKRQWKKAVSPLYESYNKKINGNYFKMLLEEIGKVH
ncbi:DctP family TRAP transporter solute-binding subunit [Ureibacillus sp. FSL K6-8385]|uniref:DctP family TRAP transporter solute-binding subunit n=1 Tax=Ureibacillus terrenus TaxID=118246 RepID=A0A540V4T7_9BACL|nr:DctP family TRAP transporter solute-binding subunit [Ureibacillus terrenus]MED3661550.1 DctP family TRAP transporter solute-binding subunit [Ureibacillus terrenus]MED3764018.1 DctP family TRAP transporter solute-binding subunit [Ureibacillus terrenus]TQE91765.1 DctP family TRAP transporter solute-binding subunit [Ureibacillus terrenus]